MINEFDKEIDAILRKAQSAPSAFADGFPAHLDADEISAFAENALPENAKMRVTPHLADCERCRKILSNLILLNSDTPSEFVHQATSTAATIPWYRKFLAFPNLAYSLGALALVFGALIVFTVLQGVNSFQNADLSKMSNKPYERESTSVAANANSPAAPANVAASPETNDQSLATNTMPQAVSNSKSASEFTCEECGTADEDDEKTKNKDSNPAKDQPPIDGASGAVRTEKSADVDKKNTDEVTTERQLPAPAILSENKPASKAEAKSVSKEGETTSVGGKTFRRQGVAWVDSAYQSGSNAQLPSLTYVSRGSSEYKKLDGGLRNIAEKLSGVVIVVWKNKGYRIQ